ncbi:MAG: DUF3365 domain-containing protein [Candidatus Zixiibacteriota bacterium]
MKKYMFLMSTVVLAVTLIFISCSKGLAGEYPDATVLSKAAEKEIESFSFALKKGLSEAINTGGTVNAIAVCSELAPEIAMAHAQGGWSIMRISDKSRNRNNQANSEQLDILSEFIWKDQAPPFIAEWKNIAGTQTYFYYKPIYVQELCLNCHGSNSDIKKETSAKLAELYPDDAAFGYKINDLRGMFVVEIAWPAGRAHAEALVSDSI